MGTLQEIGQRSTTVKAENGVLTVTYHQTDVVKADLNGDNVTLDTGGWLKNTTRNRMVQASNQFDLGFNVSFADGVMTVWGKGWEFTTTCEKVTFNRFTGELYE